MAQTITFSQASYVIDPPSAGTGLVATNTVEKLYNPITDNIEAKSSYLLQNYGSTTVTNLTLNGEASTAPGLNVSFEDKVTTVPNVKDSLFTFGTARDTLVIGSSVGNTANMGNGNDTVTVNFTSTNDTFNLGSGSDQVVFGGAISNTVVNLGSDSVKDEVHLAAGAPLGVRITGADSSDVLFIGTTQYNYQTSTATGSIWVNPSDPSDTKNFS